MIEIRFHGRGGQGAVIASTILANAAFMEGKNVQAFPYFGVERRGAPVTAYTRISDEPIRIRSEIYEPDHIVVLDTFILTAVNVTAGLKDGGTILINSRKKPEEFVHLKDGKNVRIATVDATSIALKYRLGSKMAPIVNTAILGGFVRATNIVKLETLLKSVRDKVPIKPDENAKASEEAYHNTMLEGA